MRVLQDVTGKTDFTEMLLRSGRTCCGAVYCVCVEKKKTVQRALPAGSLESRKHFTTEKMMI